MTWKWCEKPIDHLPNWKRFVELFSGEIKDTIKSPNQFPMMKEEIKENKEIYNKRRSRYDAVTSKNHEEASQKIWDILTKLYEQYDLGKLLPPPLPDMNYVDIDEDKIIVHTWLSWQYYSIIFSATKVLIEIRKKNNEQSES